MPWQDGSRPLVRVGFPIHDRVGGSRILHIGYKGAQQLFGNIVNTILLKTFEKNEAWVLETLDETVRFTRDYFDQVSVDAQDATRTDMDSLLRFCQRSIGLGVHRVRLADTVGMITPSALMDMIETLLIRLPGLALEFHGHNDLGMATANAVSAVDAGAKAISVTVNGLGERAGNAPLEETAMAL